MGAKTVLPGARSGCVSVPASKSWAHRILITAALSGKECRIECDGISADIRATVKCLNGLGADIAIIEKEKEQDMTVIRVSPIKKIVDQTGERVLYAPLLCGESGSTLRFLIPVAGALGINSVFHMEGRLSERPLEPLISVLSEHGMSFRRDGKYLYCSGQLKSGKFSIPGNISSQYISGLLMALPVLEGDSILEITEKIESGDYIAMTVRAVEEAGIRLDRTGNTYRIKGSQKYIVPEKMVVEKDWSSAAFPLSMGAFSEVGMMVTGLNLYSVQGDKEIADILMRFGAGVYVVTDEEKGIFSLSEYKKLVEAHPHLRNRLVAVQVKKGMLKGQTIDASAIPDLVPVISAVATGAEGKTAIINAARLRIKESDRLATTTDMLKRLGAGIEETEDGLVIRGGSMLTGGTVDSFNDHRIAMSAAVAAGICKEPVEVNGAECTDKSFPGFWEMLERIEIL